jgi:glycosyltransferase involved in cell wall biosynthesis
MAFSRPKVSQRYYSVAYARANAHSLWARSTFNREPLDVYKGKSLSVLLPTYNEKDSIRGCIQSFERTGVVDEILVVNNNAAEGTSEEVAQTGAVEIFESRQGYGAAIVRGLREAQGDLVCICEPDGTFDPHDLFKMLPYSDDIDIVYGTRTVGEFIWQDANMGWFIRLGNWLVAKLMEVLFNTNSLSDVGCTLRLLNRPAVEVLLPLFREMGNCMGAEMMCLSRIVKLRSVQIPVNYRARVGVSSVTGRRSAAMKVGLRMIWVILSYRMQARSIRVRAFATSPAERLPAGRS